MAESTAQAQPVSAFSLFTKSKEVVLANLPTYAVLFILPLLMGLGANLNNGSRSPITPAFNGLDISPTQLGLGVGVAIIVFIAFIIVSVMVCALNLLAANGKKPGLDALWPFVSKFTLRIIGISIVTSVIIVLGLMALVVPGVIFIRRYFLAPYVLIDQDLSIGEAMRESARLTRPYPMSFWGLVGVNIILNLPSFVPVIGWAISFVLGSLYTAAPAIRYLELKKLNPTGK